MKQLKSNLIKLGVIFTGLVIVFFLMIILVVMTMAQEIVRLPEKATAEAVSAVKEFFIGSNDELLKIDFDEVTTEWANQYEWINPITEATTIGLPEDIVLLMKKEDLLVPPSILISIASLKDKTSEFWIEELAQSLSPRDLEFEKLKIGGELKPILVSVRTYLGKYTITYKNGKVNKISFSEDTDVFDTVLKDIHLGKEKDLIIAISQSYDNAPPLITADPDLFQDPALIGSGYFGRPIDPKYPITSVFGERFHPIEKRWKLHAGTDFGVPIGTPVYASADGVVIASMFSGKAGNFIEIRHDNGYSTRYLHLSNRKVGVNMHVSKGQLIALSGNTGGSTGPHLHFEIKQPNGTALDPETHLSKIY